MAANPLLVGEELGVVVRSPDASSVFTYTPDILRTTSGRLLVSLDFGGPGVDMLHGPKAVRGKGRLKAQGQIVCSDDEGRSWKPLLRYPFWHARFIRHEKGVYLIGHDGDVCLLYGGPDGMDWPAAIEHNNTERYVAKITHNDKFHASACNYLISGDAVVLVMEKRLSFDIEGWNVAGLAPVLMKGDMSQDLMSPRAWTFSRSQTFRDFISPENIRYLPIPFYACESSAPLELAPDRVNSPIGWLEANVAQVHDPNHIWFDGSGRSFIVLMRAHTSGTGFGCVIGMREDDQGNIEPFLLRVPSGREALLWPMPFGHLKFDLEYDARTRLYWAVGSLASDSMRTLESLSETPRFNLPNNERHLVGLFFSKNLTDWCPAGIVARGATERESRNYPSMEIDGDDLLVVCRSTDCEARDPQYSNIITFHRVRNFRSLVYAA